MENNKALFNATLTAVEMKNDLLKTSNKELVKTRKRPQITTHMPRELFEAFRETTDRLGQNQSAVIRLFVQSYVDRNKDTDLGVAVSKA